MGKVIAKRIRGMNWSAKVGLVLLCTLLTSIFMYQGWSKPKGAQATVLQGWTNVYGANAFPTAAIPYTVTAGVNRVLVVGVTSSVTSATATQTCTVKYGTKDLTAGPTNATTSSVSHTSLFYLKEADIAAASNTNLEVTITGGTANYNSVFAAVYSDVDQNSPLNGSGTFTGASANSSAVGPLSSSLTIASGDQAVEVVSLTRTGNTSARTISTWSTGWNSAPNLAVSNTSTTATNGTATYAATNVTAGVTTSQHTASSSAIRSMSAMVLKGYVDISNAVQIGNGVIISSANVCPGTVDQKLAGISFITANPSGDNVTGLTVTTAGTSAIAGMKVMNEAGDTQYYTTLNAPTSGNDWSFTGGTPIPVTSTIANYKVLVTYSAGIPTVTATTANVTNFTNTLAHAGANTVGGTLTVQTSNVLPPTAGTQSGNAINWTRSGGATDSVLVVRYAVNTDTTQPVEGTVYTVGSAFGVGGTVAYVGAANTFTDTVGGTWYYRIFEYNTCVDYSATETLIGPSQIVAVSSITPSAVSQGATANITITGGGFTGVTWLSFGTSSTLNIQVSSFTVVSDTQINATLYVNPSVAAATRNLILTSASGTAITSGSLTISAAPTISATAFSPASGAQDSTLNVNITGTNFQSGASAGFGSGITTNSTTWNSATSLTANITITTNATLGLRDVTVTNPNFGIAKGLNKFTVLGPKYTVPGALTFPTATATGITVTAPYIGDSNNDNSCAIAWGTVNGTYPNSVAGVKSNGACTATVTGLISGSDGDGKRYYFQATFSDADNNGGSVAVTGTSTTNPSTLTHNSQNTNSTKYAEGWGVSDGKYGAFTCSTCHDRNTTNARLVAMFIKAPAGQTWGYPGYSTASVFFRKKGTDLGSDTAHATSTNACEVCHSQTRHHLYNNPDSNHTGGGDCTVCHTHDTGFQFSPTVSSCSVCHNYPPSDATHSVVSNNNCTPCHNNANPDLTFKDPTKHGNGTVDVSYGCVSCHDNPITRTKGRPGTQLADVVQEFNQAWSHKRSAGGLVTDEDCVVCHLEGDTTTKRLSSKHADGNIDLRDPAGASSEAAITNISGDDFTFQRFSTSYAPGSRTTTGQLSNNIDNVITQKFCLNCHNAKGATNPGARVTGGTQYKPFNTTIAGAGYVPPMSAGVSGGVVNVDRQFTTTNAAAHPVKGPRNNSFASYSGPIAQTGMANTARGKDRMFSPYGVSKTRGLTGQPGIVINCFDCHNNPTPLTLRTVTAHGNAVTLRGVATNSSNSAATAVTLCIVCHAGYNTNTGSNHGAGSAINSNTNSSMANYLRYSCNYCHSSGVTTERPYRGEDMHGFDRFIGNNADTMWPIGPVDTYKPYSFMRNTLGWSVTSWKPLSGPGVPTGSATCGGQSVSQSGCTGESHSTYTPGGSY